MRTLPGLDPLLLSQLRAPKWIVGTNIDDVYTMEMYGHVSLKT